MWNTKRRSGNWLVRCLATNFLEPMHIEISEAGCAMGVHRVIMDQAN